MTLSTEPLKYTIFGIYQYVMEKLFSKKITNTKEIPIIINNFNRIEALLLLIECLEKRGYKNIHILDNQSSYPPLMEYYKKCPYPVYHLENNFRSRAFWKSKNIAEFRKMVRKSYYVYTDSDVVLRDECPDNVLEILYLHLQKYRLSPKIGLSIRIDDLPDHYKYKQDVIDWESRFWLKKNSDGLYRAPVDTTFALYRPRTKLSRSPYAKVFRTPFPYQIIHLPWYNDSANLTEEETYFKERCLKATFWSSRNES